MLWLHQQGLMLCLRVDEEISFVTHRMDKVHLFMSDWVRVVVLHRLDYVNEVDFRTLPVVLLVMLMMSLRDVMVIRRPVVLGVMFLFRGLCCWVNPEVLVEVMSGNVIVSSSGAI